MDSRSSLLPFFQRSWISGGTWHLPDGLISHNLRNLFIRAPSVAGGGLSPGGSTEPLAGFVTFVAVGAGVVLGDGAATLGGGVARSACDFPLLKAAISACIFWFASTTIKIELTHYIH